MQIWDEFLAPSGIDRCRTWNTIISAAQTIRLQQSPRKHSGLIGCDSSSFSVSFLRHLPPSSSSVIFRRIILSPISGPWTELFLLPPPTGSKSSFARDVQVKHRPLAGTAAPWCRLLQHWNSSPLASAHTVSCFPDVVSLTTVRIASRVSS